MSTRVALLLVVLVAAVFCCSGCRWPWEPEPDDPALSRAPASLSFTYPDGSKTLSIRNSGDGSLSWSVSENYTWMSCSPTSGSSSGETDVVSVSITWSSVPAGTTKTGTISISSNGGSSTVEVTATRPANPVLSRTPSSLSFTYPGGSKTFDVWNSGSGTLSWSVSDDVPWLSCSPISGSSTGEHDTVTATVDWGYFSPGETLSCTITITSNGGSSTVLVTATYPQVCSITVTSPVSADDWEEGSEHGITWDHAGACEDVVIGLRRDSSPVGVIAESTPNDGYYQWEVDDLDGGMGAGYRVRIMCLTNPECEDHSDSFSISEGIPECVVVPQQLDFGSVPEGETEQRQFTITNAGGGVLSGAVYEHVPKWSIPDGQGPFELGPGEVWTSTVQFDAPWHEGVYACTVDIGNPDCGQVLCTAVVPGPDPECYVNPEALDFGTVAAGETKELSFRIENIGGGTLTGYVSAEAGCSHYEIVSGGEEFNLSGDLGRKVTVRFTAPELQGTYLCTVNLGTADCPNVACTATVEAGTQTVFIRHEWKESTGDMWWYSNHPLYYGQISFDGGGFGDPWSNTCDLHTEFIYLNPVVLPCYFYPSVSGDGIFVDGQTTRVDFDWTAGLRDGDPTAFGEVFAVLWNGQEVYPEGHEYWGGYTSCHNYSKYYESDVPTGFSVKLVTGALAWFGTVRGSPAFERLEWTFHGWEIPLSVPVRSGRSVALSAVQLDRESMEDPPAEDRR